MERLPLPRPFRLWIRPLHGHGRHWLHEGNLDLCAGKSRRNSACCLGPQLQRLLQLRVGGAQRLPRSMIKALVPWYTTTTPPTLDSTLSIPMVARRYSTVRIQLCAVEKVFQQRTPWRGSTSCIRQDFVAIVGVSPMRMGFPSPSISVSPLARSTSMGNLSRMWGELEGKTLVRAGTIEHKAAFVQPNHIAR